MESVDGKRKNKRGVIGDNDDDGYIGGKKGNGDGGVLSSEKDCQIVGNMEGKKKRKKNKEKGSKKERVECVVSGHVGGNDGGDEKLGEMEIGAHVVRNSGKSEGVGVHGKLEKKKKKEKTSRKERKRENDLGKVRIPDLICADEDIEKVPRKKERKREKEKTMDDSTVGHVGGNDGGDENVGEMVSGGHVVQNSKKGEVFRVHGESKKKKKKEKRSGNERKREKDLGKVRISDSECADDDVDRKPRKKKRKREEERVVDDSTGGVGENLDKEVLEDVGRKKRKTGKGKNKKLANGLVSGEGSSTIEMETKDGEIDTKNKGKGKQMKQSENTKAKKGKKKVSFSGQVEVFAVPSDSSNQEKIIHAKRYSAEEDKIIQEAVHNYIEERGLGEEGLNMVLHCKSQPEVRGCWKVIAEAIPYRHYKSVYNRAHILFERGERREWSAEEIETLRKYNAEHGNKWKDIAEELGRHRRDVKDVWRRLKVSDKNQGRWLHTELQTLFDLVNSDLRLKIIEDEEKKKKHGMLKDNIHWTAISDTLKTRTGPNCSQKWYGQLRSPMVTQGIWADIDDHLLIDKLYTLDASCIEDVDWDNLLDHRSGDICRSRWNQMVLPIGKSKSFSEQVEILTRRYCPDLIEVREAWEKKPVVD